MIADLKVLANRRDVPYQSLLKVFLAERPALQRHPRPQQRQIVKPKGIWASAQSCVVGPQK
jgi:hypothetical protein